MRMIRDTPNPSHRFGFSRIGPLPNAAHHLERRAHISKRNRYANAPSGVVTMGPGVAGRVSFTKRVRVRSGARFEGARGVVRLGVAIAQQPRGGLVEKRLFCLRSRTSRRRAKPGAGARGREARDHRARKASSQAIALHPDADRTRSKPRERVCAALPLVSRGVLRAMMTPQRLRPERPARVLADRSAKGT